MPWSWADPGILAALGGRDAAKQDRGLRIWKANGSPLGCSVAWSPISHRTYPRGGRGSNERGPSILHLGGDADVSGAPSS